jgi:2-polyprenyl-3-methyl-5-hydroxy-6-metoxy-1,4-benzoquinol methylase
MEEAVYTYFDLHPQEQQSNLGRSGEKTQISPIQPKQLRGIDYGCGPTEVFRLILQAPHLSIESYDPLFFNNPLSESYDFIICQEVCEHFKNPKAEFAKLKSHLHPQGVLFLKTKLHTKDTNFFNWFYAQDFTHVCFYSATTLQYLAQIFQKLVFV